MNENLSYSFHIGNDKNKTSKARQIAKERPTNFNKIANDNKHVLAVEIIIEFGDMYY